MAEAPTTTQTPDITAEINQQFFIERLSSNKSPKNYLEHFPKTIYNTGEHSNLVTLMYTLLGPSGLGLLRKNYFEARLAIEEAGLRTTNLDDMYNNIFAFARFAEEIYEEDTEGLLTQSQYEKIQEGDKAYQARAVNFLAAARAGGTPLGVKLAAKSGLDRNVEIVENYRALYDEHSDDRLGIEYQGVTRFTEEVILLPRQEVPTSAVQILRFANELRDPIKGGFRLAFPLGEGETNENKSASNPSTGLLEIKAKEPTETPGISTHEVEVALEALPQIGKKNIYCTGGPLPAFPIQIHFTNELSDRKIPPLIVTFNNCADVENLLVLVIVEQATAGVDADEELGTVAPENWHYAETAIGKIKPVTTIISPGKAPGITKRQPPSAVAADSKMIEVLRYVSGLRSISWPPVDSTHWIVPGVEKEAPKTINGGQSHYTNFHNINTIKAYNDGALKDSGYEAGTFNPNAYLDEKVGLFNKQQREIYQFLTLFNNELRVFLSKEAEGVPERATYGEGGFISGTYHPDYVKLPGAEPSSPAENQMWSSEERPTGIDVLEIDFGTVQAVNFITLEASNKPYNINVAYDILDEAPVRQFQPVTYVEPAVAASVLGIGFQPKSPNFWNVINLNFSSPLGTMIYTRFIRVEFEKRTGAGSIFTVGGKDEPYSIEVRNLKVGRNISS